MRISRLLPALLLLSLPAARVRASEPAPPPGAAEAAAPVAKANNAFAGDLFRAIPGKAGNLFFSPYSISVALAMTLEGARGETAKEMRDTLRLPAEVSANGHQALAQMLRPRTLQLEQGPAPTYRLSLANAMWGQQGYSFRPEFGPRLQTGYGAQFFAVDFRRLDQVANTVNAWVSKATEGRIRDVVAAASMDPRLRLILTNAVYFKARWAYEFFPSGTKDAPFTRGDATQVRVRLMRLVQHLTYGETERAQVLELPYLSGDIAMVVVLPKKRDGLDEVETKEGLGAWAGVLQGGLEVDARIPKFTFSTGLDLAETLKRMGIRRAFDPAQADLGGIAAEPLFVGAALHKAFIAVDEVGTEAAAVTVMPSTSAAPGPPPRPVDFIADHPFVFFIRHRTTGTVLFFGRVADPV